MGSFICKQPNGLLCRFSTIVDCPTHYNMTEKQYVELQMQKAKDEAEFNLSQPQFFRPFEHMEGFFGTNNMTRKQFNKILKEMKTPITEKTETNIPTLEDF